MRQQVAMQQQAAMQQQQAVTQQQAVMQQQVQRQLPILLSQPSGAAIQAQLMVPMAPPQALPAEFCGFQPQPAPAMLQPLPISSAAATATTHGTQWRSVHLLALSQQQPHPPAPFNG